MQIRSIDGLPVIDAKKPLTIHVNKKDIDNAEKKDPAYCAVALACRRELHAVEVRVHLSRTYIRTNKSNWVRYFTPPAMRNEIVIFDRGGRFLEGEFTLSPITPSKQKRGQQGSKKNQNNKDSGKKRRAYRVLTDVRSGPVAFGD